MISVENIPYQEKVVEDYVPPNPPPTFVDIEQQLTQLQTEDFGYADMSTTETLPMYHFQSQLSETSTKTMYLDLAGSEAYIETQPMIPV